MPTFELQTTNKNPFINLQTTNKNPFINLQITRGMCVFGATLLFCFCFFMVLVVTAVVLATIMYYTWHMDTQDMINEISLQLSAIQRDCLPSEISQSVLFVVCRMDTSLILNQLMI